MDGRSRKKGRKGSEGRVERGREGRKEGGEEWREGEREGGIKRSYGRELT